MAKKQAAGNGNKETAIDVGKTIMDPVTHKQVINQKFLEPAVLKEVQGHTKELQAAMTAFGTNALRIGEILTKLENLLKHRGLFVAYLNELPGFTQSSAYRFINAYNVAKEQYNPHVLEYVLSSGIKMIGNKDKPYGVYQDVVKKLPAPRQTGDESKDKVAAQKWVNQVEAKYREGRKRGGGVKEVNANTLQREAWSAVIKRYYKVPDKKQLQWIRGLFSYILADIQFAEDMHVEPKAPPVEWTQKTGEATGNAPADASA